MTRIRRAGRAIRAHQPHIYATGAVLSAVAASAVMAAGVAPIASVLDTAVVLALAAVVFIVALVGNLLMRRRK